MSMGALLLRYLKGWGSGNKILVWREAGFDEGKGHGSTSEWCSEVLDNIDEQPSMFDGCLIEGTDVGEAMGQRGTWDSEISVGFTG